MLDELCGLFDSILPRGHRQHSSRVREAQLRGFELRLLQLAQRERFDEEPDQVTGGFTTQAVQVAELYRLAALIYLERVARNAPRDSPTVEVLTGQAFSLLEVMSTCERPWPLFVVALEATTEEQRRTVLAVLDASLRLRPLGNLASTRRMVEAGWVMQDLTEERPVDALEVYEVLISANKVPPSFT